MSVSIQPSAAAAAAALPGEAAPADRPRFGDTLRGTQPQAVDQTLAHIAAEVYDPAGAGIDGWQRLDAGALRAAGIAPGSLEDRTTGLRAALYTDGEGRYALAFAGSNDVQDWLNNLAQGVGLDSAQYNQAIALAKDARLAFGDDLAITGHSLGGGLAAAAALATGSPAVTFNAAGVADATLRDAGLDPAAARDAAADGQIRRYAVNGEILTTAQEDAPLLRRAMPDAPGHRLGISAPPLERPRNDWLDWLDGDAVRHHIQFGAALAQRPVTLHMMDSVLSALARERPWMRSP